MVISRWRSRALALVTLSVLFVLAACSTNTLSPQTGTPTSMPTATPIPGLIKCAPSPNSAQDYSSTYYSMLPEVDYSGAKAYAQIQLPPQTRYLNDSASAERREYLCSAGTTDSVLAFMTDELTQLGWQKIAPDQASHCLIVSTYAHPQCWQNGKYELFLGINSQEEWILAFIDPAFLFPS